MARYLTAALSTFFVGEDAESSSVSVAGSDDIADLRTYVLRLRPQPLEGGNKRRG
jgi:hypothetical protein